ncbi:sulfurtransferase [Actinomycetospora soli]|uniref:sulfurtransferase n=1 Tax=Actinomycetospora soli TaxID=2893887 RepID=UPI001E63A5B5|nr:rhodanese-like domain-containing protein [Actinomycetospora soli]MCD2189804.1 sulfurtransferase [Actinomycetospora soli]
MPNQQGPLVSAADLLAELAGGPAGTDGRPIVLDVRWRLTPPPKKRTRRRPDPVGEPDFDAGHVPGAVFVDVDSELAGPPGPAGRHPLPDPDDLQTTLRRASIAATSSVVVYDAVGAGDGMAAARAWWVLRWAGLAPGRVRVLDGGFGAWTAAGGESSTVSGGVRRQGDVDVAGGAMPVLTAESAGALAQDGVLLDARAAERYRGETEPIDPVAGHIPGAVNLPVGQVLAEDGRWRPAAELAELLGRAGLGDGAGAGSGAYCGSGVSAAMLVLAAEIAGVRPPEDPVALYVGSWSNWVAGKRPVETG